jgi:hypothetical protein
MDRYIMRFRDTHGPVTMRIRARIIPTIHDALTYHKLWVRAFGKFLDRQRKGVWT